MASQAAERCILKAQTREAQNRLYEMQADALAEQVCFQRNSIVSSKAAPPCSFYSFPALVYFVVRHFQHLQTDAIRAQIRSCSFCNGLTVWKCDDQKRAAREARQQQLAGQLREAEEAEQQALAELSAARQAQVHHQEIHIHECLHVKCCMRLGYLNGMRPCMQAVREQSEELRALKKAINEAKAAQQRQQQEQENRLLKVTQLGSLP